MSTRIAINGFGRIGRCVTRIALNTEDVELVAVNDLGSPEQLVHLFEYDSVHGTYDGDIRLEGDTMHVDGDEVKMLAVADPSELPWDEMDVDVVLESTGVFRKRDDAAKHLAAGADKVVISAPGKGVDLSMCMGINHGDLKPEMEIVDVASCTTNCLAPVAKALNDAFGIEQGLMTTVHAYTNNQNVLDTPHGKDFRRARAAAVNMIPTTTGAAVAVTRVLPELEGKLNGMAIRVPTPNVSCVDLVVKLNADVGTDEVNEALKAASEGELEGILGYSDKPLVSTDYVGNPHSSIVDAQSTMDVGGGFVKVLSWYDNEWGFSHRMIDAVKHIANVD